MVFFLIGTIYFALQSYLILTTNIQVYPEIYLFSWLVHKGLLPYRDFFDHHGFFLYFLFAPISSDITFFSYKIVYFIFQSFNLLFLLLILRKISSKTGYIVIGFLFVWLNYFVSENILWYEIVITTFFLLAYYLVLEKRNDLTSVFLGIIILFSSFIKPSSSLLLFPVLVSIKKINSFLVYVLGWELLFLYYIRNNGVNRLFFDLFTFNRYILLYYHRIVRTDLNTYFFIGIGILVYALYWIKKEKIYKTNPFLIPALFISPVFLSTNVIKPHILPFVTIVLLTYGSALLVMKNTSKYVFLGLLILYCILIVRKTSHLYGTISRLPQQEEFVDVKDIYPVLDAFQIKNSNLYIMSTHVIEYISYNVLPPTYIPLDFPLLDTYFPHFESFIINDLKKNRVELVIRKKETQYPRYPILENYIQRVLPHQSTYKKFKIYY